MLDGLQALVNRRFDVSSTVENDIEEEVSFGTLEFKPIQARVTSIVDAKTGQRINDDFRCLVFKDITHNVPIGTRYRFEDNIWIVYSSDNIKTATSSVYVRRCNNTINTYDKYGVLHKEPCYIDYKIVETRIFREEYIDSPQGRIWVQAQRNKWTEAFDTNDRFLFDRMAYRIRTRSGFDRRSTFDNSQLNMISYYAEIDGISNRDDLELQVASNDKEYIYTISCDIKDISSISGDTGTLVACVKLNDVVVNEPVYWQCEDTEIATINDNGEYTLLSEGETFFIVRMKNKNDVALFIPVLVKQANTYSISITPNIETIKIGQTVSYTIHEEYDGEPNNTTFTFSTSGVPKDNYEFTSTSNGYTIKNLRYTPSVNLKVTYKNNRNNDTGIILYKLGGTF